jgi:4'-phosphopantetheinyl transferase
MTVAAWSELHRPSPGTAPDDGECHVWPIPVLARTSPPGLLSPSEIMKVDRFRSHHARSVFIASRLSQRLLAGHYLDATPAAVTIVRDCRHCGADHGRPRIFGASFDYSVSHAGDWLVLAVVGHGLVGVDVELTAQRAVADLAESTLTPAERERLASAADPVEEFVRLWTRKEAVLKLTGHGLAAELTQLDVTGAVAAATAPPAGWPDGPIHLLDLPSAAGTRTALATTSPIHTVTWCGPLTTSPE